MDRHQTPAVLTKLITRTNDSPFCASKTFTPRPSAEPETFETVDDAFLDAEFRMDEPERARAAPAEDADGPGNALAGLHSTPQGVPPYEDGARQDHPAHRVLSSRHAASSLRSAAAALKGSER